MFQVIFVDVRDCLVQQRCSYLLCSLRKMGTYLFRLTSKFWESM